MPRTAASMSCAFIAAAMRSATSGIGRPYRHMLATRMVRALVTVLLAVVVIAPGAAARPQRGMRLLAVAVLGLGAACIAVPFIRDASHITRLGAAAAAARHEAEAAASLRKEVEARDEQGGLALRRRQAMPTMSALLAEMTRLFPDGTWATQLQIDGDTVTVTGYSPSANALISLIEQSEFFEKAAFRSPVTQDAARGVEQFHLSINIRKREAS
jgi:general secretion pathway protein L